MAMSSSLAGAEVAGAVGTALAAVLGSGAGLKSALGVPARKISIKKRKRKKKETSEDELPSNFGLFATSSYVCRPELFS